MKHILTVIIAAASLWCSQPALANDPEDYMYIPGGEVTVDDKGQAQVYVWLKTNVVEYNTIIMKLYLPEGFTILKNNRGKYIFNWNTEEDVAPSHVMSYADHDGYIRMLGTSVANDYLLDGNHWLFNFTLVAPEGFNKDATASFRDIEFSEGTVRNHYFDDVNFVIHPKDLPDGIGDIYADDAIDKNKPVDVYNLSGIRVADSLEHLAPGVYIVRQDEKVGKIIIK